MTSLLPRLACLLILTTGTLCAAGPSPMLDPAAMMPDEWVQYRMERFAVVQGNPDLAAKQKALDAEFRAQADRVDAAMIKANPATAPVLARAKQLLNAKWDAKKAAAISVADWQTLRASRAAVLKANPVLAGQNRVLLRRQKALKAEVDSALIKADPALAPFIEKLRKSESGR